MHAEGLGAKASGIPALVVALIASVGDVASIVPLALMLVRVMLWLLRYRRPELGTEAPDGARGVVDPTIDRAVDDAEREYFSTRYWLQER